MPAVPQKIRTGLVELRTHIGPVYVSPSFWERIYLLWTFRNFPILPKQVLNRHQQQLIDKLCRGAIVSQNRPIARTSIIGAVENVSLLSDCKAEGAVSSRKVVEMGTASTDVAAPAVGSERISMRSSRAAYNRINVGRFLRRKGNVQYISAPKPQSESKPAGPASVNSQARRMRSRNKVGCALVAACAPALLGILFYFREGRHTPLITVPQGAIEAHEPASASIPRAAAAQPDKSKHSMSERRQSDRIIALTPSSPAVSSQQNQTRLGNAVTLPQPPAATDATPQGRLQVAEAPESGFCPVAPSPTLTGKVRLKAVIGTDGTVTEVDVLSGKQALARVAMGAVQHWRYRPHELNGHAVEAETNILISFLGIDAVSISFLAAH